MLLKDIDTNKIVGIEAYVIDDYKYLNNDKNILLFLKNGDSKEYIINMAEQRQKLPKFIELSPKNIKQKNEIYNTLNKVKTKDDLITKIKSTLFKYHLEEDFNYREISDIIKSKDFYNDISSILIDNLIKEDYLKSLNDDKLKDIIIHQTVFSLEKYSMIHPKIKLLISELGKESFKSYEITTD